ncbi:Uncharacterised protein [Neisseria gonorrhoeae]|nr:hypothetical protein NGFG_02302 [Neisseria gonorrhoeae MS11]AKP14251.1 hypothetical protein WX61_00162 [Neisseria gonorrhoeae]CEZ99630.1 Uncharacterised protein [Neisseria gonorrhoeae]CFA86348.1 Uncharacterised protein [Neisseria gonorrhoeae]CFC43265.1 Uncharacterised protein [Neisseria gonorrhoeae]
MSDSIYSAFSPITDRTEETFHICYRLLEASFYCFSYLLSCQAFLKRIRCNYNLHIYNSSFRFTQGTTQNEKVLCSLF